MRDPKKVEAMESRTLAHFGFLREARKPVARPRLSQEEARSKKNLQKVMVFPVVRDRRQENPDLYLVPPVANDVPPSSFVEMPIVVGILSLIAPPVGLSVLWLSSRYKRDAKIALSVLSTITFLAMCAVAIAYLR